ncbi:MAG: hypothetical protein ACKN9S_15235 [Pirellula sp.]
MRVRPRWFNAQECGGGSTCEANQSFVIPTPLAIVLAICQGPLRLLPCRIACRRGTCIATNASVRDIGNKLKAGFPSDADAASSGRTVEPVVLATAHEFEAYGLIDQERLESIKTELSMPDYSVE